MPGKDREFSETVDDTEAGAQQTRPIPKIKQRIESEVGMICEIATTTNKNSTSDTVLKIAQELECDVIVTPYEEGSEGPSSYIRSLFRGDTDVIAFRPRREETDWKRIFVPVRKAGTTAHAMLGIAWQLVGVTGRVSACSCISQSSERRATEQMLATLVETLHCPCETHVTRAAIDEYIAENASQYDLLVIGASTDRSAASRLISRPTFEQIQEINCDIAIIHSRKDSGSSLFNKVICRITTQSSLGSGSGRQRRDKDIRQSLKYTLL